MTLFLKISAEEVQARIAASHADVHAIHDYWLARRGERGMPRRADLDPSELKRFLANMMLVEVTADARRFIYRLVGTAEVESRGLDPTGRSVAEASFGDPEEAVATYDYVVRNRAPYCHRDPYEVPDGETETEDIIYLPLCDNHGAVNMILVFTHSYSFRRRAKGSAM